MLLFASSSTSSSVENLMIEATGPKICCHSYGGFHGAPRQKGISSTLLCRVSMRRQTRAREGLTSSRTHLNEGLQLESTVGSMKKPSLPHFLPPVASVAPSKTPDSTYERTLSRCCDEISGPNEVFSSSGCERGE